MPCRILGKVINGVRVSLRVYVAMTTILLTSGFATAIAGLAIENRRTFWSGVLILFFGFWVDRVRSERVIIARYMRVVAFWRADIDAARSGDVRPDPDLLPIPPEEPLAPDEPVVPAARRTD